MIRNLLFTVAARSLQHGVTLELPCLFVCENNPRNGDIEKRS